MEGIMQEVGVEEKQGLVDQLRELHLECREGMERIEGMETVLNVLRQELSEIVLDVARVRRKWERLYKCEGEGR